MRILMVSPHPVYSPRGTPISVFNRAQALGALGHRVDLVTYPVGEDRPAHGLHYRRARVPGVHAVAVGLSPAKVVLNGAVTVASFATAVRHRRRTYDVVHTHEEAGLFGPALARVLAVPHVYDMGNGWSDVLRNYGLAPRHPLVRGAGALEDRVIRRSGLVLCHFPVLAERVRAVSGTPAETVVNSSLDPDPDPALVAAVRAGWCGDGSQLVVYAGTLEAYQGVGLLVEAMGAVLKRAPDAVLVVLGGRGGQVAELRRRSVELGLARRVHLVGTVPPPVVAAFLEAADVLVSPRLRGENTPLKIFSYLRSGRPIVATDIASHTQVLDADTAVLVPPTPEGLAGGIATLLEEGPVQPRAAVARDRYGVEGYVEAVARAYTHVGGPVPDERAVRSAAERIREGAADGDPEGTRRVVAHVLRESTGREAEEQAGSGPIRPGKEIRRGKEKVG
ncbi:MAG TPA: glycosyltransferase [Acidimicrobiales bacterium]|nr:glycosyltransferase [Acidimicrobiales bacterium]